MIKIKFFEKRIDFHQNIQKWIYYNNNISNFFLNNPNQEELKILIVICGPNDNFSEYFRCYCLLPKVAKLILLSIEIGSSMTQTSEKLKYRFFKYKNIRNSEIFSKIIIWTTFKLNL